MQDGSPEDVDWGMAVPKEVLDKDWLAVIKYVQKAQAQVKVRPQISLPSHTLTLLTSLPASLSLI